MYVDLLPPCNAACPAGENIQAWLAHVKAGEHERAWRVLVERQPVRRRSTAGSATTRARPTATAQTSTARSRSTRSSGSWAIWRSSAGGAFDPPAVRSGKRVLVIGAGPSGLSAAYHLARLGHEVEIRDAGPEPGGMMRYGIPAYRMPRDVLSGEIERIAALGVRMTSDHRVTDLDGRAPRGRLRRGVRRGRRAPVQAGGHPRAGRGPDRGRRVVPARRRVGRAAGDRAPRRGLRRRQHRDGRGAGGAAAGRGGGADRLPPHARADAGARGGGRRTPSGRACGSTGCGRSRRSRARS